MESRIVDAAGLRMRWEEAGAGIPVILLHGFPTNPSLWRHVVPRLQGARCLAWELVGYGASMPLAWRHDLSLSAQAEYLWDWVQALGIPPAIYVGHDLGGGICQILAVRHPVHMLGMVLVDSVCDDSWPAPGLRFLRFLGSGVEHLSDASFRAMFAAYLRRGHEDRAMAEESFAAYWPHYLIHGGARALERQVRDLEWRDTARVYERLGRVRIPARLVWGDADPYQSVGYGHQLALHLRAPFDRIPRARHFLPEDRADRVAEAIGRLVAEVAPGMGAAATVVRPALHS